MRSKVSASDLVQKTFLVAHSKWQSFEGTSEAELRQWLASILHRQYLNQVESYRETRKRDLKSEQYGQCDLLAANSPTGSAILLRREEMEQLLSAIANLPSKLRSVIELRHIEQLPVEEVALRLGISRHVAYRRWKAALKELAHLLRDLES